MAGGRRLHCVAVVGGAVAGAQTAATLAARGAEVVVFEQNPRPWGKIEDGLPRWHVALRHKEYEAIAAGLTLPGVHYVPDTGVGRDLAFADLVDDWGFSAVVLACGAWRDRPLPVDGADAFVDRGLVYQNPFIMAFNHEDEPDYKGTRFPWRDGALVVGGGLASIDVAKVLTLSTTRAALAERGVDEPLLALEQKGIPKILERHGLVSEDLGLEGCTIFYRRDLTDMPLVEVPEDADAKREEKVRASRVKLLSKATEKYCFRVEPLCMPDGLLVEGDALVGLRFRRTRMESGRPVPTDATFERRGPYVISSIGSLPAPIEGVPMRGDLFDFSDWELGRLPGLPTVFAAGNVATGKGNIIASCKHARAVATVISEAYLGLADDGHAGEEALAEAAHDRLRETAARIGAEIERREPLSSAGFEQVLERVRQRQRAVGYDGDYKGWIARSAPAS